MDNQAEKYKMILGTVQLGQNYGINDKLKPSEEQSHTILDEAHKAGIRWLDTADNYGSAITTIGNYLRRNHNFQIFNKFILTDGGDIDRKVEHTLRILDIDHFEVYSYHRFKDFINSPETRKKMLQLKDQRLIKKIGISIYSNLEFRQAIDTDVIDVIQIPLNILDNTNIRGALMDRAVRKGKEIHARSIFLQGLFFTDENRIPNKIKPLIPYLKKIKDFSKENNIPINEIALTYVVSNPNVSGVLIGVRNVEQLTGDLNCLKSEHVKIITNFVNTLDVKETQLLNPNNWK
jgi:aryl-alcohol dehydrogenase-like predicted oxidoreductase